MLTPLGQRIIVRFARKPIWMRTADSKLFRIAEHNFYSPEEIDKIKSIHKTYTAQVYSLQQFMKHEFFIPASQSGGLPLEFVKKEQELDRILLVENDAENVRIAKIREEVLQEQFKQLEMKLLREKYARDQKSAEDAALIDEYIKNLKSDSDSFVTEDNIESLIDRILENPISHEYAITISGQKVKSLKSSNQQVKDLI